MILQERVSALVRLGEFIKYIPEEKFKTLAESIRIENPWFTEASVRMAVSGITKFLDENNLSAWLAKYPERQRAPKTILLIMAGNIPLAGFHDFLCVLVKGDVAMIKVSSKDSVLIRFLAAKLIDIDERFALKIKFNDQFKNFDAVIATGSDNSSRYFDYYFGKYPHIIRKNRTSVAILEEKEGESDLSALASDVFSYFGLGCRNVAKLFLPHGYNFDLLFKCWESYRDIVHHHKYYNNYAYQKSILTVSQRLHLDNGFVLLQENDRLVSPLAVIYYQHYKNDEELCAQLNAIKDKLQCIVGNHKFSNVAYGTTQSPNLEDYADRIDTMAFLSQLT